MAKSPEEMAKSMIANLPGKTGKSLDAWLRVVAASDAEKHGQVVALLKKEHGMTHGYANLIAHKALEVASGDASASGDDLVAAQYAGAKAGLKPIHDKLIKAAKALGRDIEVLQKKTYVSLRRQEQFALVQPSTKTRVDLGLKLKGVPPEGKLEASGSFNAMVSHRVRLFSPDEVNSQVLAWLKQAYEGA